MDFNILVKALTIEERRKLLKLLIEEISKPTNTLTTIESFCRQHRNVMSSRLSNFLWRNKKELGDYIENIVAEDIRKYRMISQKTEDEFVRLRGW